MERISFQKLNSAFVRVLLKNGFSQARAKLCARLFAESSRDGVYSHGLNRFPLFIEYIEKGYVDVEAVPQKLFGLGCLERWDGMLGPGNTNAWLSMQRAIELAGQLGVGCVALRNTNHWMRGGSYGWQAADAGCIGICWTNTLPNLPPWGAASVRVGNNPLVIAIPRREGNVVLDMAMSRFSYGKLETYRREKKELPVEGGYDVNGKLTRDPAAIEESGRVLPVGFWKGSGLALALDLIATLLSGGDSTTAIGKKEVEYGISQVFIAFDLSRAAEHADLQSIVDTIIGDLKDAQPAEGVEEVLYPGERTLRIRHENLTKGVPVDPVYWKKVQALL